MIYRLLSIFAFLLLFQHTNAQIPEPLPVTLKMGDPAPALNFGTWFKGKPITSFEKGKVYVLEFWATWCAPCRAAMPHISTLAKKYKRQLVVIGVDVMELESKTTEKIKSFVDSMGKKMNYHVVGDDKKSMEKNWFEAVGGGGIPKSFIVDGDGKLAWFGHPRYLPQILPQIIENRWNIQKEIDKRLSDERIRQLEDSLVWRMYPFAASATAKDNYGRPDSAIVEFASITRQEPLLKYSPKMGDQNFLALLRLNSQEAFLFGKAMLDANDDNDRAYDYLISSIDAEINRPFVKPQIYELGAQVYQRYIDWVPYPELSNMPVLYTKMAEWYGRAGNRVKAMAALRKAKKSFQSKKMRARYKAMEQKPF